MPVCSLALQVPTGLAGNGYQETLELSTLPGTRARLLEWSLVAANNETWTIKRALAGIPTPAGLRQFDWEEEEPLAGGLCPVRATQAFAVAGAPQQSGFAQFPVLGAIIRRVTFPVATNGPAFVFSFPRGLAFDSVNTLVFGSASVFSGTNMSFVVAV